MTAAFAMPKPTDDPRAPASVVLHVCLTCKGAEPPPDGEPRAGARLMAALADAPELPAGVVVVGVECLSNCKRACTVALSGPGRWTYVVGDVTPEMAAEIVEGARRYAATADGVVPWRERPEIFRKGVIARVPPLPERLK
jgi:predicted metal-binding protein